MINIGQMTKEEFMKIPLAKWNEEVECFSLVVIPGDRGDLHDSGYRTMTFIAVDENGIPFKRISGGSDVIHIEGIGGLGQHWLRKYGEIPRLVPPREWSIDCLPKSGFLRIISRGMICGEALSSFEIFSKEKK